MGEPLIELPPNLFEHGLAIRVTRDVWVYVGAIIILACSATKTGGKLVKLCVLLALLSNVHPSDTH